MRGRSPSAITALLGESSPPNSPGADTALPGLRQRNRLQKRSRIRQAVRELFSSQGFEATTLRQIADRAQVGLGTLFNYARDKRDLTFLLFNEDLARLADEAITESGRETRVLEQVMAVWEPHYRFFAQDPVLCRILLRDMYFYEEGTEARRFHGTTTRLRSHLLQLVESGQRDGQLAAAASATDIAALLFSVFESSVRYWMHEETPAADEGLATLRRRLEMLLQAFVPGGCPRRSSIGRRDAAGSHASRRPTRRPAGTAARGKSKGGLR
jgi:AcrR family transcriptional regulator